MNYTNLVELIGYLGSLLIAVSLSMKSLWKLRVINFIGSSFFAVYGYLIGAVPIFVVNSYIAVMNVWYLIDYRRNTACFVIDSLESVGECYFKKFYGFYEDDIRAHFPSVSYDDLKSGESSILFRNMIPVGIFSIRMLGEGRARIIMDYIVPEFRDFKFGLHIYHQKSYLFRDRQINRLEAVSNVVTHQKYLLKLGFVEEITEDEQKIFVKNIF